MAKPGNRERRDEYRRRRYREDPEYRTRVRERVRRYQEAKKRR